MDIKAWLVLGVLVLLAISLSEGKKRRQGRQGNNRPTRPQTRRKRRNVLGSRPVDVDGARRHIEPTAMTNQACLKKASGGIRNDIEALWTEVRYLSNPVHLHIERGDARHWPHSNRNHQRSHDVPYHQHSQHHRHTPGGRRGGHTVGGRKPHHTHKGSHGGHTAGGKEPHHTHKGHQGHGHETDRHYEHSTHIHVHVNIGNETDPFWPTEEYVYARCDLTSSYSINGVVLMRQKYHHELEIKVNITGMLPFRPINLLSFPDQDSEHGLHVHEFADLSEGCTSFGSHYNPKNRDHGHSHGGDSHAGDWGNISFDSNGESTMTFNKTNSDLLGPFSIVGRGLVLHKQRDDLGKGGNTGSLATGNAGERIACGGIYWVSTRKDDEW